VGPSNKVFLRKDARKLGKGVREKASTGRSPTRAFSLSTGIVSVQGGVNIVISKGILIAKKMSDLERPPTDRLKLRFWATIVGTKKRKRKGLQRAPKGWGKKPSTE